MNAGLFVTGTDTGVGKTVVCAALMHRYRPLLYWKPIQTGTMEDDDTATVRDLGHCSVDEIHAMGLRFEPPVSPHLAARLSGERIDISQLLAMTPKTANPLLVEGAGGLLVPLNPDHLTADFIAALKMPVLVVARSTLGTINHTLLTLEALRSRSILVGGIVMNGPPNPENRLAIETYGKVAVLGEMPRFDRLTPDGLRDWAVEHLDPQGALLPYLKVAT